MQNLLKVEQNQLRDPQDEGVNMIYIKYLFMAVFSLVITIIAFIIAPVLPFFATIQDGPLLNGTAYGPGPRLPKWLNWFMTPDNSLDGDEGWQTEHWQWRYKFPTAIACYIGQVGWLWRNPAYSYGMKYIDGNVEPTYTGDPTIKDNANAKEGYLLVHEDRLFQYVCVKRIFKTNKCFYINLGWNIRALLDPGNRKNPYRATFVFSPRVSGFDN